MRDARCLDHPALHQLDAFVGSQVEAGGDEPQPVAEQDRHDVQFELEHLTPSGAVTAPHRPPVGAEPVLDVRARILCLASVDAADQGVST